MFCNKDGYGCTRVLFIQHVVNGTVMFIVVGVDTSDDVSELGFVSLFQMSEMI